MPVQVCRAAGLYGQAQWVAQAAGEPLWYLEILIDDCQQYDEALAYLAELPRVQAADAVHRFGQVEQARRDAGLTAYLHPHHAAALRCCRPGCMQGALLLHWGDCHSLLAGAQVLVNERTEGTTALLMQLCTQGDPSKADGDRIAEVSEFAALYSYRQASTPPCVWHLLGVQASR